MNGDDIDVERYREARESGWDAARVMERALRDGVPETHAIRLVRGLSGTGWIDARELDVKAATGQSLDQHQEQLL